MFPQERVETLEDHVVRGRFRPMLALALASSVLGIPALLLAHVHVVPARLAAGPALAVAPAGRIVRGDGATPDAAPPTTVTDPTTTTVPPTTVTSPPTTVGQVLAVVRPLSVATPTNRLTTTTTVRRPPPTTAPPHPPTTRPPPPPPPRHTESGAASWYSGPSGVCAHPYLPLGTVLTVTDVATGVSATCRVGGRGPFGGTFIVDLDPATFSRLAPLSVGVIDVVLSW